MRIALAVTLAGVMLGCGGGVRSAGSAGAEPPTLVIGLFEDDYGGSHSVSATMWTQGASTRYHITRWVPDKQYFIAHNDPANKSDGGKWTRIDWLPLTGMPPYEWAFCFSAYNAPTAAAAESTVVVKRETPRTGCNGFPFSRMKRVATR